MKFTSKRQRQITNLLHDFASIIGIKFAKVLSSSGRSPTHGEESVDRHISCDIDGIIFNTSSVG